MIIGPAAASIVLFQYRNARIFPPYFTFLYTHVWRRIDELYERGAYSGKAIRCGGRDESWWNLFRQVSFLPFGSVPNENKRFSPADANRRRLGGLPYSYCHRRSYCENERRLHHWIYLQKTCMRHSSSTKPPAKSGVRARQVTMRPSSSMAGIKLSLESVPFTSSDTCTQINNE